MGGNLLNWLGNLLSERTHQTNIGSAKYSIAKLLSGVIRGSGVGPLLFLIYLNELIDSMESKGCGVTIKLFAGDAKIYAEIIDIRDVEKLQRALDLLDKWVELWQLTIATYTCFILTISKIPSCVLVSGNEYRIDDCILRSVASCQDLGLNVSCDLSTREHVDVIVLKAILLICYLLLIRARSTNRTWLILWCSAVHHQTNKINRYNIML